MGLTRNGGSLCCVRGVFFLKILFSERVKDIVTTFRVDCSFLCLFSYPLPSFIFIITNLPLRLLYIMFQCLFSLLSLGGFFCLAFLKIGGLIREFCDPFFLPPLLPCVYYTSRVVEHFYVWLEEIPFGNAAWRVWFVGRG